MTDFKAARLAMVDCQIRPSDVTRFPIIEAMLHVPREDYVPPASREVAYMGDNIGFPGGRAMLDPRVLGKMLDALAIGPDDVVLDVGCLTGYSTALVARMAAQVTGVEADEALAQLARENFAAQGVSNATVITGDLTKGAGGQVFDVILIAGGLEIFPKALQDQLKLGGRVAAIFMQGNVGHCQTGIRTENGIAWRQEFDATAPVLPGFARAREFQF